MDNMLPIRLLPFLTTGATLPWIVVDPMPTQGSMRSRRAWPLTLRATTPNLAER
jgi:hypothetical protein